MRKLKDTSIVGLMRIQNCVAQFGHGMTFFENIFTLDIIEQSLISVKVYFFDLQPLFILWKINTPLQQG